jgi:hypothetical protein
MSSDVASCAIATLVGSPALRRFVKSYSSVTRVAVAQESSIDPVRFGSVASVGTTIDVV